MAKMRLKWWVFGGWLKKHDQRCFFWGVGWNMKAVEIKLKFAARRVKVCHPKTECLKLRAMERNFHVMFPPSKPTVDGRNPAPVHCSIICRGFITSRVRAGFQPSNSNITVLKNESPLRAVPFYVQTSSFIAVHCIFSHSCSLRHRYSVFPPTHKKTFPIKCTPQSLCRCVWGEFLSSRIISAYPPFLPRRGAYLTLGPQPGSWIDWAAEKSETKKSTDPGRSLEFFFLFFPGGVPSASWLAIFAMDFGIGRVAQQTFRHVVEGGRSPRRKQSLDASSRSSWDDETRGPGLPGVTPTGSQNPCTHRISEFWFPDFLQQIAGLDLHGVQVSPLVWPQILELQNAAKVDDLLDGWDTNGWQCFSSSNLACAENLPKATKRKLLIFTNQHSLWPIVEGLMLAVRWITGRYWFILSDAASAIWAMAFRISAVVTALGLDAMCVICSIRISFSSWAGKPPWGHLKTIGASCCVLTMKNNGEWDIWNFCPHWEQIQNSLPPGFLIRNQWQLFRGITPHWQPYRYWMSSTSVEMFWLLNWFAGYSLGTRVSFWTLKRWNPATVGKNRGDWKIFAASMVFRIWWPEVQDNPWFEGKWNLT